jgi:deoxyribonuclease V
VRKLHDWDVSPAEARAIQQRLRERIVLSDELRLGRVSFVAGVDVGFEADGGVTRAAVAVLSYPELKMFDRALAKRPTEFPYVPGLLSFREIPAVLDALGKLDRSPDLLLCDGQGYAHPRRFGLACHLGLLTGVPSIGVAKTRLIGEHGPVGREKGDRAWLRDEGEVVGAVLRTRRDVKPLYISVGHRISLETAIEYVLGCTTRYRLPETTRAAHRMASK